MINFTEGSMKVGTVELICAKTNVGRSHYMGKFEYYFGWRRSGKLMYPVRWIEEDGRVIGGQFTVQQKVKVDRKDYLASLAELEVKYPYKEDAEEIE